MEVGLSANRGAVIVIGTGLIGTSVALALRERGDRGVARRP